MTEIELIEKWKKSGLLETVTQEMKFLYSKNFEKAQRFMEIRNGNDQIETLIYPIVFRITKQDKSMDVIKTIEDFIQSFETNKLDIYKDYINYYENDEKDGELEFVENFINDEKDGELEFVENFIKNYIKNKLN